MSFYLPNDYLNRYGFWSERPVSKALKNFDDYYNTTSSNKFMKYCRKVIFDLESKNIALRRTLRDEKEKKMEWNWEALAKRTKKGDFTFLKHLPNYNDFDWESLSKKKTKPEPQVQDKPKFETGIAVWYVNPNKGVPRIAQIQKVYTDDPTGVYYDVKFREPGDITQTVEAYLHAIDGSPVSEAFGKLTEKLEKYEAKQKAIKTLVTSV